MGPTPVLRTSVRSALRVPATATTTELTKDHYVNIRSLSRGDGAVIGAAVLLLISSFLDFYSVSGCDGACGANLPNAWKSELFPILPSIFLAGLIAAGLIVGARFVPEGRKLAGITLNHWGTTFAVFAAWSSLWTLIGGPQGTSPGTGAILGLIATLAIAAVAILEPRVPALGHQLLPEPTPKQPQPYGAAQPYGGQPSAGYGYPGGAQPSYGGQPQPGTPFGGGQPQPGTPFGGGAPQPGPAAGQPAGPQPGAPGADFAPFWFAVPVTRPLYAEDGSPTPVAELTPGTWYLAVDQRGAALVAQTQDGRRGVLQDTTGIQRG
jgi:hypothetical protein